MNPKLFELLVRHVVLLAAAGAALTLAGCAWPKC
jgi:hypothetical protein